MDLIHKISLYADVLHNADTFLPSTLQNINKSASVSDYSINWNKSIYLPIGYAFSPHPSIPLKFGNIQVLPFLPLCLTYYN